MSNLTLPQAKETLQWSAFLMCILAAIFYCYEYCLRVAPSVMRENLMLSYQISDAGFGILAAFYYWAYVPLQVPVGLIMDRFGPRRILTAACLLCALGTYFFAVTDILNIAMFGRFIVGFGSAFAYVGVLKIANLFLPRKYFAMMAGLCTALGTIIAGSSAVIMANCVSLIGWQATSYCSASVGLILALILWLIIKDKSDQVITQYSCATHEGRSLLAELLEVIKIKQLFLNGIIGCLTYLPLTIFAEVWAVRFLETVQMTKVEAAFGSSLVFWGFGIGAPIWGIFSDWIHSRKKPLILGSIISALCAWLVLYHTPEARWLTYTLLFASGFFASAEVVVFAVGNDLCQPRLSATTVSYTNFLVMLGGMLLQPLIGIVVAKTNITLQNALMILPLGLLLAAILSMILQESYNKTQEHVV
jgi:MFS family permease